MGMHNSFLKIKRGGHSECQAQTILSSSVCLYDVIEK